MFERFKMGGGREGGGGGRYLCILAGGSIRKCKGDKILKIGSGRKRGQGRRF